jgi:hypothetical protein
MKANEYTKPNIANLQIPELMQTILPGGSNPPGEGDAKQNNLMIPDDEDTGDTPPTSNENVWHD